MHKPPFKMPTIRQILQLIQQGDYAFSIDLKDVCLHILIIKCHCHILHFVMHINLISGRFCHLGWSQPLGFSLQLLNPFCSFANAKVFILLYIWIFFSSFGKISFCASGYAQLCWICHVIQSDMLNIYHHLVYLYCSFHLFSTYVSTPESFSATTKSCSLVIFSSWCGKHYSQPLGLFFSGLWIIFIL